MEKTTLIIEGMGCGMCEAQINGAIRRDLQEYGVKKVTSSHIKGITEIISERSLDEERLRGVITCTGYQILEVRREEYEKKRFSLFKRQ
ncbi:MAG: heavy-metal-associated domain-containing protein [Anaerovoracaceae bacterium]